MYFEYTNREDMTIVWLAAYSRHPWYGSVLYNVPPMNCLKDYSFTNVVYSQWIRMMYDKWCLTNGCTRLSQTVVTDTAHRQVVNTSQTKQQLVH